MLFYILTNKTIVFCTPVLKFTKRIYETKVSLIEGFTKKYNCHKLIYFDETNDVAAIQRKRKSKVVKEKKVVLIECKSGLLDLAEDWY